MSSANKAELQTERLTDGLKHAKPYLRHGGYLIRAIGLENAVPGVYL